MKNDPVFEHFLELSWRRKLTLAEEVEFRTWLETHPEAQGEWEAEIGLNDALGALSDTAVSSNFNTQVMQGIEREMAAESRRAGRRRITWWRQFIPKVVLAAGAIAAGVFSYQQFHTASVRNAARRAEAVQSFMTVSKVPSLPGPEILEDFDAIRLSAGLRADEKLLTLLQ